VRTISRAIKVELLNFSELAAEEQELIEVAVRARMCAQSPYYHWWVGAAIICASGEIYDGCNVENANASETVHAEECAFVTAVKEERKRGRTAKILGMAIAGGPEGVGIEIVREVETYPEVKIEDLCFACGHCLQTIQENSMADPDVELLLLTRWGEVARTTLRDAFPMPFGPESLGIDIRRR
jgi:cytidine deaminase